MIDFICYLNRHNISYGRFHELRKWSDDINNHLYVGGFSDYCKFVDGKVLMADISNFIDNVSVGRCNLAYQFVINSKISYVRFPNLHSFPSREYLEKNYIIDNQFDILTIGDYIVKSIIE